MTKQEIEIQQAMDDALAQALTSAIASYARGDPDHAMFMAVLVSMYVATIHGCTVHELLRALKGVDDAIDFSHVKAVYKDNGHTTTDEEDLPVQNAPTSSSIN